MKPSSEPSPFRLSGGDSIRMPPAKAASSAVPACPSWLGNHGRKKWKEILPLLIEQHGNRVTAIDADALANYCHAYQNKREAMARLGKAKSEVCSGPNGALYPHPDVGARNKADERMKTWGEVLEINFNKRKTKKAEQAPAKRKPA